MQPTKCPVRPAGGPWMSVIAAVVLVGVTTLTALAVAQRGSTPRFTYGAGARGVGYQAAPRTTAPAQASRPAAAAARPATVGPGARNWATGNRVPLHRPWLSSR